jgi:hypothetical protein
MWMIERRKRPCFALKTIQTMWITPDFCGQNLQRDLSLQICVFSNVNDTHPTCSKLINNVKMGKTSTNQRQVLL